MEKVIKILMLEDNIDDAALIQIFWNVPTWILTQPWWMIKSNSRRNWKKGAFDAVLSDHALSQFNSTEA